nr:hypothetical protein GCM10025730_10230 [Promicromonospora thailandica]
MDGMHPPDTTPLTDRLDGRRALVTGASKGTGAAIMARLRAAGATVLAVARTAPDAHPAPESFVAADLTTTDGVARVVEHVERHLGGLDVLVHSLGARRRRRAGSPRSRSRTGPTS